MKTRTTWLICSLLAIPGAEVLAADNPWVGTWTLDPGKSHLTGDTFTLSRGPGRLLHYADGSDHPITGPTAPPGFTSAFKLVSPTKLTYVLKIDGKPIGYGVQTLAPDGRTFTDVTWNPGKESEKLTSVYLKQ
jgi:hypothetical protein